MARIKLKKLLLFLFILFSFNAYASQADLADGTFTIRDVIFIVNVFAGMFWGLFKSFVLTAIFLPSYIIVNTLIDTPFGSFLEFPEYGYVISPYMSLGYWLGIFLLFIKIDTSYPNKNFGFLYLTWFTGPFILGFLGLLNGWWLSQQPTVEFLRISEFANCINSVDDSLNCMALF